MTPTGQSKPRIGAEITPTTVRRILDMREPLIPSLSPKYRGRGAGERTREAVERVPESGAGERAVSEESRTLIRGSASKPAGRRDEQAGRAKGNPPEQGGVGPDISHTEETDSVRRREGGLPEATRKGGISAAIRGMSWRRLLIRSAKIGAFLGLTFVFLSIPAALPEQLIAVYATAALLFRIDSQRTFIIALIFLALVAGWSLLGNTDRAEAFAVYAFYFLVIGLIGALREIRSTAPA